MFCFCKVVTLQSDDSDDEAATEIPTTPVDLKLAEGAAEELEFIRTMMAQEALVYGAPTALKKVCVIVVGQDWKNQIDI